MLNESNASSYQSIYLNEALLSRALATDPASLAELNADLARHGKVVSAADVRLALDQSMSGRRLPSLEDAELGLAGPYDMKTSNQQCTCRSGGTCP
jgi:hypothetical protein